MLEKSIRSLLLPSLVISLFITGAAAFEEQNDLPTLADSDPARPKTFYSLGEVTLKGDDAKKAIAEMHKDYYFKSPFEKDKIIIRSINVITNNNVSSQIPIKDKVNPMTAYNPMAAYNDKLLIAYPSCVEVMVPHNGKVVKTIPLDMAYRMYVHKNEVYISSLSFECRFCVISNNLNSIDKIENLPHDITNLKISGDNKIYVSNDWTLDSIDTDTKKTGPSLDLGKKNKDFEIISDGKYLFSLNSETQTITVLKHGVHQYYQNYSYGVVARLSTGINPVKMFMHDNMLYVQHSKGIDRFDFKKTPDFKEPIKASCDVDNITSMFVSNKKVYIADKKNVYTLKGLEIVDPIPLKHDSMVVIAAPDSVVPSANVLLMAKNLKKRADDAYFSDVNIEFSK